MNGFVTYCKCKNDWSKRKWNYEENRDGKYDSGRKNEMKWNEGINEPRDFEMDWKRNPSEITEFEWIKIKIWNEIQWKLKWKWEDTKRSPMKAQVKWIRRAKWNPRYFCIIIEEIWPRKENYIEY